MMKANASEATSSAIAESAMPQSRPGTPTSPSTPIRPIGDIFELEKMRVYEKIVAYTHKNPDELLNGLDEKLNRANSREILRDSANFKLEQEFVEKVVPKITEQRLHGGRDGFPLHPREETVVDTAAAREVHYLLRMYRQLKSFLG